MKLFEKKDSVINIEEDDLQDAKLSSLDFQDKTTKKRAFLNVLGARLAMKMLFSQKIEATNLYSLYTIHNVLKELDIADIYFQGLKIDVRVVFDKEEIFIPKSHFELDLLPDLYLVFDLAQDFSCVEFLGFFEPKTLNTQNENKDFYFYEYDRLQDPKTLKLFLNDFKPSGGFKAPVELNNAEALFVSLVDKDISQRDKNALFQCLAGDIALREKMVEFENFETLSKEAAKDNNLMQDGMFDIVGAQQVHEYEELTPIEEKAEVIGEVLSDLLDDEDETPIIDEKNEISQADLEEILSEVDAEHEENSQNDSLAAFAAGAAAGAVVGGVAAGAAAVSAAANAGLGEGMFEALPDLDLDIDLGGKEQDLMPIMNEDVEDFAPEFENEIKYETIENQDDLLNELSELEGMEDLDESSEAEDDAAIQAKFFGSLQDDEESIGKLDIEEDEDNDSQFAVQSSPDEAPVIEENIDINDDDLNMINDTELYKQEDAVDIPSAQDDKDDVVSFDEISEVVIPKNYDRVFNGGDDETLERLRMLEEEEDGTTTVNTANNDEVLSEVDEFLKEAESSGANIAINPDVIEGLDSSLLASVAEPEITYQPEESTQSYATVTEDSSADGNLDNDQIKLLFQDEKLAEIPNLSADANMPAPETVKAPTGLKNKKMLVVAAVASVALIAYVATQHGVPNNGSTPPNAPIATQAQAPVANNAPAVTSTDSMAPTSTADEQASDIGGDPLLQPAPPAQGNAQANVSKDMNKAVSDAFLSEPVSASISKVAWEVPEDLAYNDGFRKYLQMAGKNLKLNLQNNLLLATEMAYSNKVVVDLTIGKDGSVQTSNIIKSSGSKQIDKIVLQSVKDTLTYLKIPASEVSGNSVEATLIINF